MFFKLKLLIKINNNEVFNPKEFCRHLDGKLSDEN